MKNILRRLKIRVRIYFNWLCVLRRKGRFNAQCAGRPSIFFDLTDMRQEVYYFPIIYALHENGFEILIANNPGWIGHVFGPGRFIYELPNVTVVFRGPSPKSILITDRREFRRNSDRPTLVLNSDFLNAEKAPLAPYPMHPNIYRNGLYKEAPALRQAKRSFRVLFSGNTEPSAYQSPTLEKHFQVLNRVRVIDTIRRAGETVHCIEVTEENREQAINPSGYLNAVVMNAWQWSPESAQNIGVKIPLDQWLRFLSKADFFLACPGITIPFSHNAIEAMSVGTIPITNYGHLFNPPLTEMETCISFSTEEELVAKVRLLLSLGDEDIAAMRAKVVRYYEQHLDYLSRVPSLMPSGDNTMELYFINEALS